MPVLAVGGQLVLLLLPPVLVFERWIGADHCSGAVHCSLGFEAWSHPSRAFLLCRHFQGQGCSCGCAGTCFDVGCGLNS